MLHWEVGRQETIIALLVPLVDLLPMVHDISIPVTHITQHVKQQEQGLLIYYDVTIVFALLSCKLKGCVPPPKTLLYIMMLYRD